MASLHEDIRRLGELLGEVLRERCGAPCFERIERIRAWTKSIRGEGEDDSALREEIRSLSLGDAEGVVRAFSLYFQLVNMAEEHERSRRLAESSGTRKEGIRAALLELRDRGASAEQVRGFISSGTLGLTFTAHPTEMRRRTVREHLSAIASDIDHLGERSADARIAAHIEALWGTLELRRVQPTVRDEVQSGLSYLPVIASVLPDLTRELREAFAEVFGEACKLDLPFSFHSWMGGDRDGNPNVTPEVTAETFELHRERAVDWVANEIARAFTSLSQHRTRLDNAQLADDAEEPFRARLVEVHDALRAGEPIDAAPILEEVEQSVRSAGMQRSADMFALPARVMAQVFGRHLVSLDLREHSKKTGAAAAELLRHAGVENYEHADEEKKCGILERELATRRPLLAIGERPSESTASVIEPMRAARCAVERSGSAAFGRYITSMSEEPSDLLEVALLAREVGLPVLPVPLFETRDDLARAPEVMRRVLSMPTYRALLGSSIQEVMIGYSDSNKDAGFFAANWSLFVAQRDVARVCSDAGVPYRFFHGRGTSIGRGGGPMLRGLLGLPKGTLDFGLRITEQGEALADKYSRPDRARRNLEQAFYGLLLARAADEDLLSAEEERAIGEAAEASVRAYRELVEDEHFLPFFEAVTPINEISELRIASRPVRRPGPPTLENLRAIPWVMSWIQNRANVPGWYGLHVALRALGVEQGRALYRKTPFFRSMLDNAQMGLSISDPAIFALYLSLASKSQRALGERILEARAEAISRVEEITEGALLANEPRIARSIELRNPYVEPIHRIQVELLHRARKDGNAPRAPELERALLLCIHGIAAGVRNAG